MFSMYITLSKTSVPEQKKAATSLFFDFEDWEGGWGAIIASITLHFSA